MSDVNEGRRRCIRISVGAAAFGLSAGCIDEFEADDEPGSGGDEPTNDDGDDTSDDRGETSDDGSETSGGELSGEEQGTPDGFEIEPGSEILLEGMTSGWIGIEPPVIEGETNPTLVLESGASYEIGWVQGDGAAHNIVICDETEAVVDEYTTGDSKTDVSVDPGEDGNWIEFEASDTLAYYQCYPHRTVMEGDLVIESTDGTGGDRDS